MSSRRLSKILQELDSDSDEDSPTWAWGQSSSQPQFMRLANKLSGRDLNEVDSSSDDSQEDAGGEYKASSSHSTAPDKQGGGMSSFFSPMQPSSSHTANSEHQQQQQQSVNDHTAGGGNVKDDFEEIKEEERSIFADSFGSRGRGMGRSGSSNSTVTMELGAKVEDSPSSSSSPSSPPATTGKSSGTSPLRVSFAASPGAMRQPSAVLTALRREDMEDDGGTNIDGAAQGKQNGGDNDDDNGHAYYREQHLKGHTAHLPQEYQSDEKMLSKMLLEAEEEAAEAMFRGYVAKHDDGDDDGGGVGGGHDDDYDDYGDDYHDHDPYSESKGNKRQDVVPQLRLHLSGAYATKLPKRHQVSSISSIGDGNNGSNKSPQALFAAAFNNAEDSPSPASLSSPTSSITSHGLRSRSASPEKGGGGGGRNGVPALTAFERDRARAKARAQTKAMQKPPFNSVVFSPTKRKEVPLQEVLPIPPTPAAAHNAESSYLMRKKIRKQVVSSFESCAIERGDLLTRHEFDDFLRTLALAPANEEDSLGGCYKPESTHRYVLALRIGGGSVATARRADGVDIEGALGIAEVVHGVRMLPSDLISDKNEACINSMRAFSRRYHNANHLNRMRGTELGDPGSSVSVGKTNKSGQYDDDDNDNDDNGSSSVVALSPAEVVQRNTDKWNQVLDTELAVFEHNHPFKPTLYSVPTTNKTGHQEHVASEDFDRSGHYHNTTLEHAKEVGEEKRVRYERKKDYRTSEQRVYDENCTFSPKFYTTEVAYDRAMMAILHRAKKEGAIDNDTGKHIEITVGGVYTEKDGFVPGPPPRTNIPLFYFNPEKTPHWKTKTYHEYDHDAEYDEASGDNGNGNSSESVHDGESNVPPTHSLPKGMVALEAAAYEEFQKQWKDLAATGVSTAAAAAAGADGSGSGGAATVPATPAPAMAVVDPAHTPQSIVSATPLGTSQAQLQCVNYDETESIPCAPALPQYAFHRGLQSVVGSGASSSSSGGGEGGWAGRQKKPEGDQKEGGGGRPPAPSPMGSVLAELQQRFKGGNAGEGLLSSSSSAANANKAAPGRLAIAGGKKKKRKKKKKKAGKADMGDVIGELQKRLAKMRGEVVSEDESSSDEDEEPETTETEAAEAPRGGRRGAAALPSDSPPEKKGEGADKLVGTGGLFVKDGDNGEGVESPVINNDKVACMPSSHSAIPAPPPLPSSWPPTPDNTVMASLHGAPTPVPPSAPVAMEAVSTPRVSAPALTAAAPTPVNMPELPPVVTFATTPAAGDNDGEVTTEEANVNSEGEGGPRHRILTDLPLPEGYYQPSPHGTHKVLAHGILKIGLVTSRTIKEMKMAWKEAEVLARHAIENGEGVHVPRRWRDGIERLRKGRDLREEKKRREEKLELRYYSDESEEEDYLYRGVTVPQEFSLRTDARAAAKEEEKRRLIRQQYGHHDKKDLAHFRSGLERGLDTGMIAGMRHGSIAFSAGLRGDYSGSNAVVEDPNIPTDPYQRYLYLKRIGEREPIGAPKLHSVASFEKNNAIRKERAARTKYLQERKARNEKQRRDDLYEQVRGTFVPSRVSHTHERILLRHHHTHPDLTEQTTNAHERYKNTTYTTCNLSGSYRGQGVRGKLHYPKANAHKVGFH